MEENKLNNDDLKQVAGGRGRGRGYKEPGDRYHLTKITDFFRDKNLYYAIGTFKVDANVWLLGFYKGSRGNCCLVRSVKTNQDVYIPDGCLAEDWEED